MSNMATSTNASPSASDKERVNTNVSEQFIGELRLFHENQGLMFHHLPRVAGKHVDLHQLYKLVTSLGGWRKVHEHQRWEEIQESCLIPRSCSNGAQAVKHIYMRYLAQYEAVHRFGETAKPENMIEEEDSHHPHRRTQRTYIGPPMKYNYFQHDVPEYVRKINGMNLLYVKEKSMGNMEKALISGLPNEVDFAMNVCTLLANEGKSVFNLQHGAVVLELLLAHVGIFHEGDHSYIQLHYAGWQPLSKRNYSRFWMETVEDEKLRLQLFPDSTSYLKFADSKKNDCNNEETCAGLEAVLHLKQPLGLHNAEGQRVLQLAMIVRNLSFETENAVLIYQDSLLMKFIMLGVHSKYSSLRHIALDTLGNVATHMILQRKNNFTALLLQVISRCIASQDRYEMIAGLDILSRLCQESKNEDLLCEDIKPELYEDICSLLSIHDIHLVVTTLEALYQLSEMGEVAATLISQVSRTVETLVNLLTVEAQSYGANSLIGIKVVEHVSATSVIDVEPAIATNNSEMLGVVSEPTSVAKDVLPQPSIMSTISHSTVTSVNTSLNIVSPVVAATVSTPVPKDDAVTSACNWLRLNYELSTGSTVRKMSAYAEYLSTCSRSNPTNLVNNATFSHCLRLAFPSVEIKIINKDDGSSEEQYLGLGHKSSHQFLSQDIPDASERRQVALTPGKISQCTSPPNSRPTSCQSTPQSSPVHRVVPSLPSDSVSDVTQTSSSVADSNLQQFPSIQQALLGSQHVSTSQCNSVMSPVAQKQVPINHNPGVVTGQLPSVVHTAEKKPPDSSLIKSLLANKVAQNRQRSQSIVLLHPQTLNSTQGSIAKCSSETGVSETTSNLLAPTAVSGMANTTVSYTSSTCGNTAVFCTQSSLNMSSTYISSPVPLTKTVPLVSANNTQLGNSTLNLNQTVSNSCHTNGLDVTYTHNANKLAANGTVDHSGYNSTQDDEVVKKQVLREVNANGIQTSGVESEEDMPLDNDVQETVNIWPIITKNVVTETDELPDFLDDYSLKSDAETITAVNGLVNHVGNGDFSNHSIIAEKVKECVTLELKEKDDIKADGKCMDISDILHSQENGLDDPLTDSSFHGNLDGTYDEDTKDSAESGSNLEQEQNGQSLDAAGEESMHMSQVNGAQAFDPVALAAQECGLVPPDGSNFISDQCDLDELVDAQNFDNSDATANIQSQPIFAQQMGMTMGTGQQVVVASNVAQQLNNSLMTQQNAQVLTADGGQILMPATSIPQTMDTSSINQQVVTGTSGVQQQLCFVSGQGQGRVQLINFVSQNGQPTVLVARNPAPSLPVQIGVAPAANISNVQNVAPHISTQSQTCLVSSVTNTVSTQPQVMQFTHPATQVKTVLPKIDAPDSGSFRTVLPAQANTLMHPKATVSVCGVPSASGQTLITNLPYSETATSGHKCVTVVPSHNKTIPAVLAQPSASGQTANTVTMSWQAIPTTASSIGSQQMHITNTLSNQTTTATILQQQSAVLSSALPSQLTETSSHISSVSQPSIMLPHQMASANVISCESTGVQQNIPCAAVLPNQIVTAGAIHSQVPGQHQLGTPGAVHQQQIMSTGPVQHMVSPGTLKQNITQPSTLQKQTVSNITHQSSVGTVVQQKALTPQPKSTFPPPLLPKPQATGQASTSQLIVSCPHISTSPSLPEQSNNMPDSCTHTLMTQSTLDTRPSISSSQIPMTSDSAMKPGSPKPSNKKRSRSPANEKSVKKKKKPSESQNFYCQWDNCRRCFKCHRALANHVMREHFDKNCPAVACVWTGCDGIMRQKWSFAQHLQEKHLTESALRAIATTVRLEEIPSKNIQKTPSTYPPDAALQAIRRFTARPPYSEFMESKPEGPVTKHIRLTSALILRNIARYSSVGRSLLKKQENQLAYVAQSLVESSSAVSSCLFEVYNH